MKLYVINTYGQKVYLNLAASTRRNLQYLIGGSHFYLGNELYDINNVWAEKDSNNASTGAVVGGIIGALGGPGGVIVGGLLGGLLGSTTDEEDNTRVRKFNNS